MWDTLGIFSGMLLHWVQGLSCFCKHVIAENFLSLNENPQGQLVRFGIVPLHSTEV